MSWPSIVSLVALLAGLVLSNAGCVNAKYSGTYISRRGSIHYDAFPPSYYEGRRYERRYYGRPYRY